MDPSLNEKEYPGMWARATDAASGIARYGADKVLQGAVSLIGQDNAIELAEWKNDSWLTSALSRNADELILAARWITPNLSPNILPRELNVYDSLPILAVRSDEWKYEFLAGAHWYTAKNLVGKTTLDLIAAFELFRDKYAECMAGDQYGASGSSTVGEAVTRVEIGVDFRLPWDNHVTVKEIDPQEPSFTVKAVPNKHILSGEVTNALEMRGKELWMFQYGWGIDTFEQRWINAILAGGMWKIMANNFAKRVKERETLISQDAEKRLRESFGDLSDWEATGHKLFGP